MNRRRNRCVLSSADSSEAPFAFGCSAPRRKKEVKCGASAAELSLHSWRFLVENAKIRGKINKLTTDSLFFSITDGDNVHFFKRFSSSAFQEASSFKTSSPVLTARRQLPVEPRSWTMWFSYFCEVSKFCPFLIRMFLFNTHYYIELPTGAWIPKLLN